MEFVFHGDVLSYPINLTLLNSNSERVRVPLFPAEEPRWRVKHAGCGPVTS